MIKSFIIFLFLFAGVRPALAGEYGLIISEEAKYPCSGDISLSLNRCRPEAVVADLRSYFVEGREFEIKAVRMGHWQGDIGLGSGNERKIFYTGLASMLTEEKIQRLDELISFMSRFPFRSMRLALEAEMRKGGHSGEVEKRLEEMYTIVIINYLD